MLLRIKVEGGSYQPSPTTPAAPAARWFGVTITPVALCSAAQTRSTGLPTPALKRWWKREEGLKRAPHLDDFGEHNQRGKKDETKKRRLLQC